MLALVERLGAGAAVPAGHDVGSRTARTAAAARLDLVRALVLPEFFADAQVRPVEGVVRFTPLEAPEAFAEAVPERVGT